MQKILLYILLLFFNFLSAFSQITTQPNNIILCEGESSFFSVSVSCTDSTFQWQVFEAPGTWFYVNDIGIYQGSNNDTLFIINAPVAIHSKQYRCIISFDDTLNVISDTVNITVLPQVIPGYTNAMDSFLCLGNSNTISLIDFDNGYILKWLKRYNNTSWIDINSNNPIITDTPDKAGVWYYTALVSNGTCPQVYAIMDSVIVQTSPNAGKVTHDDTICLGESTGLLKMDGDQNYISKWQKKINNGNWEDINNITWDYSDTPISSGNWYYRSVVKNNSCPEEYSDAALIHVDAHSESGYIQSSSSNSICLGDETPNLSLVNHIGVIVKWQKKINQGGWTDINNTNNNYKEIPLISGQHYYRAVVKSGTCNSVTSDSVLIDVSKIVPGTIVLSGKDSICIGEATGNINLLNSIGFISKWQKRLNNGAWSDVNNNTNHFIDIPLSPGKWEYRIVLTNGACDTVYTQAKTIFVSIPPNVGSLNVLNDSICYGEEGVMILNGYSGLIKYWKVSNDYGQSWNYIYSNNAILKVTPQPGIWQFKSYIDSNPCPIIESNIISLFVRPLPSLIVSSDTNICRGDTITLSASGNGIYYNWSPPIGLSSPNLPTTYASPNASITYKVTASNLFGCNSTSEVSILLHEIPYVNAGTDNEICLGDSIILSAQGTGNVNWSPSNTLNNNNTLNPVATPAVTTNYFIHLTDSNGCSNTDEVKIKVNQLPSIEAYSPDSILCAGEQTTLFATGGIAYNWLPSANLSSPNFAFTNASPNQTTNYYLYGVDLNGCTSLDSIKIIVNDLPVVIVSNDTSICSGDSIILSSTGGIIYEWNPVNSIDNPFSPNPVAKPSLSGNYFVTVTDTNGCSNSNKIHINVNSLPNIDAGPNEKICSGDVIPLNVTGANYYNWIPSATLNQANISNPFAMPINNTTYSVQGIDNNGCKAWDSLTIFVSQQPAPLITDPGQICKNSYNVKYCTQTSNNSIEWEVTNGEIEYGQNTNCVTIHWFNNDNPCIIKIHEHLWEEPYCQSSDSLIVLFKSGIAPDPSTIIAKAGNILTKILICPLTDYNIYKWGYESKINNNEIFTCAGINWCAYNIIDTNTYLYWVYVGESEECLTKSYFNHPSVIQEILENNKRDFIKVYPNPAKDVINVTLKDNNIQHAIININTLQGLNLISINYNRILNNSNAINVTNLSSGLYILEIVYNEQVITSKIVIAK